LVCNIGGTLTPLGNPPIFLGFLNGVDFFWTLETMLGPTLFVSGILLLLFYIIDRLAWNREPAEVKGKKGAPRQVRIEGVHNVLYLAGVVAAVLVSGIWDSGETIPVGLGSRMPVNGLARDTALLVLTYLSWKTTRSSIRIENAFSWTPFQEVAILFAAIFITLIPILAMLRAEHQGPVRSAARSRIDGGRPVKPGGLFLAHRSPVELSRQRSYLSRLLQPCRRRCAGVDGTACRHAYRHLRRRGVHGRQHLYRQCAELHGEVDLRGARYQDADFLRLHAVVRRHPVAAFCLAHLLLLL
jgi:hypothetical protein